MKEHQAEVRRRLTHAFPSPAGSGPLVPKYARHQKGSLLFALICLWAGREALCLPAR
jgi:hypothetical protein